MDAGGDGREKQVYTLASMLGHAVMIGDDMQLAFDIEVELVTETVAFRKVFAERNNLPIVLRGDPQR